MTEKHHSHQPHRGELGVRLMAAWLNTTPDRLPPTMRAHTCDYTRGAWERVALAAEEYFKANGGTHD